MDALITILAVAVMLYGAVAIVGAVLGFIEQVRKAFDIRVLKKGTVIDVHYRKDGLWREGVGSADAPYSRPVEYMPRPTLFPCLIDPRVYPEIERIVGELARAVRPTRPTRDDPAAASAIRRRPGTADVIFNVRVEYWVGDGALDKEWPVNPEMQDKDCPNYRLIVMERDMSLARCR